MLRLTHNEVATIAEWKPINPAFGVDNPQTIMRVKAIVDGLRNVDDFGCKWQDWQDANYVALFVYRHSDVQFSYGGQERLVEGLLVYLSACAPIGVVGRSCMSVTPSSEGWAPLEINTLLDPEYPSSALQAATYEVIRSGGYDLLTIKEVSERIPPEIKVNEYSLSPNEPQDRVFHALFACTD
jgi:hypothetical protein